jgi:proline iminopeptidase
MPLIHRWLAGLVGLAVSAPFFYPVYPDLRVFSTDCRPLAYQEFGTGKPIIVLAGGPGMNPAYMMPVAQMLVAGGRRAVLFHQRGTGASADALSCRERMNLEGAVADIEALRLHLGTEKLTIAGHSWGGMLAMAYAQKHPDHVAGLLLIDTGPMDHSGFSTETANVQARLSPDDKSALQQAKGIAQIDAIEEKAYFADPGNVGRLWESIPDGGQLWYESVPRLLGPDLDKFDVTQGMKKLTAPVTLVFGRLDPGFFVAAQIERTRPSSKLIVVEHAGHYPWLENAESTALVLKAEAGTLP